MPINRSKVDSVVPHKYEDASQAAPDTLTTRHSLLHAIFESRLADQSVAQFVRVYTICVSVTYLPMLITACFEPYSLTKASHTIALPFLLDWNIEFTFFVSFPMLVILVLTDENVLFRSLERVQNERVIVIAPSVLANLIAAWRQQFRVSNVISQIMGLVIGILSCIGILDAGANSSSHAWMIPGGHLRPISFVYLFSISLLIAVIVIFVYRCVKLSHFLGDIVDCGVVVVQPFHPDKCGGLRPMGEIGLRNQYTVTVLGLNVVIFILVSFLHSQHSHDEMYVLLLAVLLYLICGPVVFLGPLLPFHRAMLLDKQRASNEVAGRLRNEFERIRVAIPCGKITQSDEKRIKRLRWIGRAIEALPVWPFDGATLRKFASAYAIPVGAALIGHLIHQLTGIDLPLKLGE